MAAKILKTTVLSIIILLVILSGAFYLLGGYILKVGIEAAGTRALGVGVDVRDIDLSVLKGMVGINGLVVKNPAGYTRRDLLEMSHGHVKTKIGSLLSNTVHIEEIKLDGIKLVIEQKGLSNNLQDVIGTIAAKGSKKKGKTEPAEPKAGKKLQIDELEITNVGVELLVAAGKTKTIEFKLAPIRMSKLGSDNRLSTAVLAEKIMLAIADGVAREGVGVLPEEIGRKMKDAVDLSKITSEDREKLLEKGAELLEGFKGLLKPQKEK